MPFTVWLCLFEYSCPLSGSSGRIIGVAPPGGSGRIIAVGLGFVE